MKILCILMEISYIDRSSGQICVEKVYGQKALSLLYGDGFFKRIFSMLLLPSIAKSPLFSHFYGYLQKTKASAKKITPFISAYGIDSSEFADENFSSFNDFFIRKLKPQTRPIVSDPNVLTTPADGRYLVYPSIEEFVIKGKRFSLSTFLQDPQLTKRYQDGSMVIVRLCPVDYHRFHFPSDGIASKPKVINGNLYSVNPLALRKRISILCENKRVITEIDTQKFGKIQYVEIGATSVGSIRQTFHHLTPVKKGEEKGYFEFGGSCIVLLFEKGRIHFDADFITNTQNGFETKSNFGCSLGSAIF